MTELRLWQSFLRQDCVGKSFEEQLELLRKALFLDIDAHAGEMDLHNKADMAGVRYDIHMAFDALEMETDVQFSIAIDRLIHKEYFPEDWYYGIYPDIPVGKYAADRVEHVVDLLDVFVELHINSEVL